MGRGLGEPERRRDPRLQLRGADSVLGSRERAVWAWSPPIGRDRVFFVAQKKVAPVRDRAGRGRRVYRGPDGGISLAPPLRRAITGLLSAVPPPQSLARSFPLCPRHPAEGAGGGGFPASSHHHHHHHHPSRQKSAPPLLANGLSSCDSVLPSGWAGWLGSGPLSEGLFPLPYSRPPGHHLR